MLRLVVIAVAAALSLAVTDAPTPKPTPSPPTPPPTPAPTPAPLPPAAWGACPPLFVGVYSVCANVTVPAHWGDRKPGVHSFPTVSFLLGRVDPPPGSYVPNTTVFYLGDGCLTALTTWVPQMSAKNLYVVAVHTRGSMFAYPSLQCNSTTTDAASGWPLPTCVSQLENEGVDVSVFSWSEIARDLAYAIPLLGAARAVVLADGIASVLAQRLQVVLVGSGVDAYVISGFTSPAKFDIVASVLDGFDAAARRILQSNCNTLPACMARLGGQDPWQLWSRLLTMASQGTLPCSAVLKWKVASIAQSLSNIVAMLVSSAQDPFSASVTTTQAFFPAFLYRLQRCSAEDAQALTTLYTALNASVTPQVAVGSCAVSGALRFNLVVNELMQANASRSAIEALLSEYEVRPLPHFFNAIADVVEAGWPRYQVPADEKVLGTSTTPTALFSGSLDAFAPLELAEYSVGSSYTKPTQQFTVLNNGLHESLSTNGAGCVAATTVALAMDPHAAPLGCGAQTPALDVIGTATPAATVQAYFGVTDLWAYTVPTPYVTPVSPGAPTPSPTNAPSPLPSGVPQGEPPATSDKAAVGLGVAFGLTWVGILVFAWHRSGRGFPCLKREKDFYSSLNRQS